MIAVVKYNAGNIRSVLNALGRLGIEPVLTDDARVLRQADRVIFPGQGEAATAMAYLREHHLDTVIRSLTQPVLGICIGQQLMCRHSMEGDTGCLGIFDADVLRFSPQRQQDKVPQIGWNSIHDLSTPLMDGIPEDSFIYNVHSYYIPVTKYTIATCDYIVPYSAAMNRDNFYATQFHPEKSGSIGARILNNFMKL